MQNTLMRLELTGSLQAPVHLTYIPLKPPDSDAAGCCSACQAHKVAAADVAGKQRSTNLDYREKNLFLFHYNFYSFIFLVDPLLPKISVHLCSISGPNKEETK